MYFLQDGDMHGNEQSAHILWMIVRSNVSHNKSKTPESHFLGGNQDKKLVKFFICL